MGQRLLILSSDTGEGHNSAAAALEAAGEDAGWRVSVRKPLEESTAANRIWAGLYNLLLTHRPGWMGLFSRTIDRLKPNEANLFYRRVEGYIARFLEAERPDVILSVHPMLNHMIPRSVAERGLNIRCLTFVTDPFPPFWEGWSSPYIDRYFVLSDEASRALEASGVSADRIERVAMPVRPGFRPHRQEEVDQLRSKLNITGETILVNGGARGGGPIRRIVLAVRGASPSANLLVVCGHNARLRRGLDRLRDSKVKTFGFVRDIHELIGAADLVMTKPGALSTYETLASAVPAVLTAIGGVMPQESGLFHAAESYGFGFPVTTFDELARVVGQGPMEWRKKREAIASFYRPGSAADIIGRIQPLHDQSHASFHAQSS